MPAAIKTQAEYGDRIQVIFVECHKDTDEEVENFTLKRGWMGTQAIWTTERMFLTELSGIPQYAILDADGQTLIITHEQRDAEDSLEAALKAMRKMPKSLPKSMKKSWTAYSKGKLGKALAELDRIEAGQADAAVDSFRDKLMANVSSRTDAIKWLIDNEYPIEADQELSKLTAALKGSEEVAAPLEALAIRLKSEAVRSTWKAAKVFAKIEKALYKQGPSPQLSKRFTRFADKYPGSKLAERANRLARSAQ